MATTPWRARRAERVPAGGPADREAFARASREELLPAVPRSMNGFTVELAQRTIVRALETVARPQGGRA